MTLLSDGDDLCGRLFVGDIPFYIEKNSLSFHLLGTIVLSSPSISCRP
jgi:hypothetical protein